jgi:hypothetical protein
MREKNRFEGTVWVYARLLVRRRAVLVDLIGLIQLLLSDRRRLIRGGLRGSGRSSVGTGVAGSGFHSLILGCWSAVKSLRQGVCFWEIVSPPGFQKENDILGQFVETRMCGCEFRDTIVRRIRSRGYGDERWEKRFTRMLPASTLE